MATHCSILVWKIPWAEGAWWAMVHRVAKSWTRLKLLSTRARIVALQCFCISFCCTMKSISYVYTYIPSLLDLPPTPTLTPIPPIPSRSLQSTELSSLCYTAGPHQCIRARSYATLCHLMDCNPPGSSVLGILQARILEWVAAPSFRRSSRPRN